MAVSLQIYESQVIQFLQSCTIVYSTMAKQINNNLIAAGYTVDNTDPTTWKYYLNLSGQYHSTDTVMQIQSLDTKTVIDFTVANLASNPKTAAAYVIGSTYYNNLCLQYPTQIDLIKSILYPADINVAITATDFTLLNWGSGYLESDEEEAIIYEINKFLKYAVTKWYFPFLSYESYYPWTFWGSLWQVLPNAIFAARLKYLKTSYVHSFHIWAYLQSKGIGDYSDILDRQQSLFLYRNIDYLIENRGTQANLVILVNNLLDTISVGLVGKTIYMNTATRAVSCQWTPEFVSTIIPTNNSQSLTIVPPESMVQLNSELVLAGLETNNNLTYVDDQQTLIGNTTLNVLPTKLVEIQKLGIDQKYGLVLIDFILDTLISMTVTGLYVAELDIVDPTTNIPISISTKDALALYYYATHRAKGEQPIDLPVVYSPSCAFQYGLTAADIPESYTYNGVTYPTASYLSVDNMISGATYPSQPVNDPNEFSTLVSDLFLVLLGNIRFSRTEGNYIAIKMFLHYMKNYVLQTTPYTYTLSTNPDYVSWSTALNLNGLLTQLDANSDYKTAYTNLTTAIASALVPWNTSTLNLYGFTPQSVEDIYDRLKSLFEQLCSYNIAFLDTNRNSTWWFLTERILAYPDQITASQSMSFNSVTGLPDISPVDSVVVTYNLVSVEASVSAVESVTETITEPDVISISSEQDASTIVDSFGINVQSITVSNTTLFSAASTMLTPVALATT